MAAEATQVKTPKERSPSFPMISLRPALERLVQFENKFSRHPAPYEKAGLAWGMEEGSSQANRILAALKSFGLIQYEGSGKDRSVAISADGRTYLRAQQDEIKKGIIRTAALKPKAIARFWPSWGIDRPPNEVCLDDLVLKHGFTEASAPQFLRVYDETISFAGLSSSDKVTGASDEEDEEGESDPPSVGVGDRVQWVSQGSMQFPAARRVRALSDDRHWVFVEGSETGIPVHQIEITEKAPPSGAAAPSTTPPKLPLAEESPASGWEEERLIDDDGELILIRYRGKPSPERYAYIRDYLDFKLKRMKGA